MGHQSRNWRSRAKRDIFRFWKGLSGSGKAPSRSGKTPKSAEATVPYMARSPAHAPAGGLWAGLMRLAALIVGHTSASFHYFHGLYSSDMNSITYIIMKIRFDIDLSRKSRRKPHHLAPLAVSCNAPSPATRAL